MIPNDSEHKGGRGLPANLLAEEGIDVLLCSDLGRKAMNLFDQHGITVHVGAGGTVKEVVEQWQKEELTEASESDACGRHAFRDRHEDERK
ncbi:MAG: NifB/NifX family molybdenum-iron cluster-binding protein [Armatimonadota bacterium]